jgi:hypothetical protein
MKTYNNKIKIDGKEYKGYCSSLREVQEPDGKSTYGKITYNNEYASPLHVGQPFVFEDEVKNKNGVIVIRSFKALLSSGGDNFSDNFRILSDGDTNCISYR